MINLYSLLFVSFFSALGASLIPKHATRFLKYFSTASSFVMLFLSLIMWALLDKTTPTFQFKIFFAHRLNLNIMFGVDGIAITFIVLTTVILSLCLLAAWDLSAIKNLKKFVVCLLYIEFCLLVTFSTLDLIVFYIAFESILIPMSIIILLGGSQLRRIRATFYFFLYTFIGSLFLLYAIFSIFMVTQTGNYLIFNYTDFSPAQQSTLWICFFIAFAVKVPMYPFHVWLPEAHVEAPTIGSVILAALLLKLGGYGFIRFLITPTLADAAAYYQPLLMTLCIIGIIYASLIALIQLDIKRVIAYASIAHMNFVILGLCTATVSGICGSILLMLAHGLVSAGLFFLIGVLYDRQHERNLLYFSGLVQTMPLYSILFFIFTLANISFPGTFNFVGEFLIFIGLINLNVGITFLIALTLLIGVGYSFLLLNRVIFGDFKVAYSTNFTDLTRHEAAYLLPLLVFTIFLGFYPEVISATLDCSVANLCYAWR